MKKHFLKVAIILCIIHHVSLAQKSGYTTAIDSTPIYYKEFGKGKPLLIINGGPGMNSEGFGELAEKLAESNRAIIYDQRGTGHSKLKILDSTTITIDLMVADIESLRQYLNIESWSVLGHYFGGILASYYATKYSQRIEKLILSSSGGIDLALLNYVGANLNSKLSKVEADSLNAQAKNEFSPFDTRHWSNVLEIPQIKQVVVKRNITYIKDDKNDFKSSFFNWQNYLQTASTLLLQMVVTIFILYTRIWLLIT